MESTPIRKKNEFVIINNGKNKSIRKTRNPGVDLIRILAMFGIIIGHILFAGGVIIKYYKYHKFLKVFHILFFWHNNGFGLVSGIIGYKTNKYSNLIYLWFCVFLYSVAIHFYFQKYRKNSMINNNTFIEFFPVIYQRYWYFSQYFGMYLFIPVINKAVAYLTKSELKIIVFSLLFLFSFWRYFMNSNFDIFQIRGGYSVIWLLTLYIIGTYIGKYKIDYTGKKKLFFSLSFFLIYILIFFLYHINYNTKLSLKDKIEFKEDYKFPRNMLNENFDCFIKLIQSLSIVLFLLQINYNNYSSKIITFIGPLTFGVYLIHMNRIFFHNIIRGNLQKIRSNLSLNSVIKLVLAKGFKIYVFCCFIEYLRNILFSFLRIRKICIYIEKLIWKLF